MGFININGKIVPADDAKIAVDNGAFRYGYGVFETLLIEDGTIKLKEYHWERLLAGVYQLLLQLPALFTIQRLEEEVLHVVAKNRLSHLCRVRLQVFAGGGGLYGQDTRKAGYVIECFPLESTLLMLNENGLTLGFAEGLGKSVDMLSNIKSCNALIYAIAAGQAKERHWNDALICNTYGNVIESTITNIFWVKGGNVYTPPLTDGCVAGVMRRHIMQTTNVMEQTLTREKLLDADEVFLTNAIRKIKWVKSIADSSYGNAITRSLYANI